MQNTQCAATSEAALSYIPCTVMHSLLLREHKGRYYVLHPPYVPHCLSWQVALPATLAGVIRGNEECLWTQSIAAAVRAGRQE